MCKNYYIAVLNIKKGKFGGLTNFSFRPYLALKSLTFQTYNSVDTLYWLQSKGTSFLNYK